MEESTKLVDESTEALWYVVHTYSGYENKVANDLQTMVETVSYTHLTLPTT